MSRLGSNIRRNFDWLRSQNCLRKAPKICRDMKLKTILVIVQHNLKRFPHLFFLTHTAEDLQSPWRNITGSCLLRWLCPSCERTWAPVRTNKTVTATLIVPSTRVRSVPLGHVCCWMSTSTVNTKANTVVPRQLSFNVGNLDARDYSMAHFGCFYINVLNQIPI